MLMRTLDEECICHREVLVLARKTVQRRRLSLQLPIRTQKEWGRQIFPCFIRPRGENSHLAQPPHSHRCTSSLILRH